MFFKETDFKATSIGAVPKEWMVTSLDNVAEIRSNKGIKSAERIAFIPMEAVPDSHIFAKYHIRRREDIKSYTYCETGDLLLAKITPSLENGKQGIVPYDVPNNVALATTEVFPIHTTEVNTLFLFHILKFPRFRNKIVASMIGTTGRQRASKESVERLEIPLPQPEEQQRITEVFSAVDSVIDLAEKVIVKTERLKKGLMQQLLTEGIGHKEFRDTEIGKIPRDWETFVLSSLLEKGIITYHLDGNHGEMYPHEEEFVNEGVPFLSANMISYGKIDFSKTKYVSEERAKQFRKGIAKDGDVLLAHNATVGPVAMLETSLPYVILGTTLTSFRCNPSYLEKHYLRYFMEGPLFQQQLQRIMKQTTRNQVPITAQRKLYFTVPAMDEQRKIAQPLCAIDEKLELERREKSRLERIKQGLMDLLLTGKIRVKVD